MPEVHIASDDRIGLAGEGAFENSVVRLVVQYAQPAPRAHHGAQLGKEHRCTGQLLDVARELARQDIEQFIEDRLGQQQPVARVYNALQR